MAAADETEWANYIEWLRVYWTWCVDGCCKLTVISISKVVQIDSFEREVDSYA
jgi:hypothetical protein